MKLRISTPESGGHFMSGSMAHVFLDDMEVSRYVSRVVLTVDADAPIGAEVTFFLTDVEIDVPAAIEPLIAEARERYAAMGEVPVQA